MSNLVDFERRTYEEIFAAVPRYSANSPGENFLPLFMDMAGLDSGQGRSVLDAGCGSGLGALALRKVGFDVLMCDFTREGLVKEAADTIPFLPRVLWQPIFIDSFRFKRDFVYCTDVLEHIPKELTMLTISRLTEAARCAVFLSISLVPDVMGVWAGRPLHRTVEQFTWWRDSIAEVAPIIECRDLLNTGLFLVRAC